MSPSDTSRAHPLALVVSEPGDPTHICRRCSWTTVGFKNPCPHCGSWSTSIPLTEAASSGMPMPASALVKLSGETLVPTGIAAVDRALGGLSREGVYMLGGDAGAGKSTLSVQICGTVDPSIYITAEETREQVAERAVRVGVPGIHIIQERSLDRIIDILTKVSARLAVVDSLQKLRVGSHAIGGVAALKEAADRLKDVAHNFGKTLLLICHVTGDLEFAGPKTVEHDVDCCAMLTKVGESRLLRCPSKNRFFPTSKTGWLRMTEAGLVDGSVEFFLPPEGLAGRCLTFDEDGTPVEVQAMRGSAGGGIAVGVGLPEDRAQMVCGILGADRRGWMLRADGERVEKDDGVDLPIALAMASARMGKPLPQKTVAWGQLTLDGRILAPRGDVARHDAAKDLELAPIFAPPEMRELTLVLDVLGLGDALEEFERDAAKFDDEK